MRFREFRRDETFYAPFLPPRAKREKLATDLRFHRALFSPIYPRPRFHERPSVLIFGRHTTRVFASNGRFPSNYVDGAEFSAFSFLTTRVSRARVNRVDIIYFSEISFFSTHTLARTDFIWTALGKGMFATGTGKYR